MAHVAAFDSHPHPFPVFLPFWRSAVFVDWHGVLCRDVFWFSILNDSSHPYHGRLRKATEQLFQNSPGLVQAWMRGQISSEDIIRSLGVRLDRRCRPDFLRRRLTDDCRRMTAHPQLLRELQVVRRDSFVVLATDNMDCFVERLRVGKDLESVIDVVLCSAQLGLLKTDGVDKFFGPWLEAHRLDFTNALLLDDNADICAAFVSAGGKAIVVRSIEQTVAELRRWRDSRSMAAGA